MQARKRVSAASRTRSPVHLLRPAMSESSAQREAILGHQSGLHLRPIKEVVKTANDFAADVTLHFDDKAASAKSAMELMLLGAVQGARLTVKGTGTDATAAVDAVAKVLEQESKD